MTAPLGIILNYHEETKHHYHRFARSLGYLDWDTQPNPFRRFEGSRLLPLPLLPLQDSPSYDDLFDSGAARSCPLDLHSLSRFFRNALAVSAWKRYESARWALRVNPSSGNLHPTEGYLILGNCIPEIPPGVYHYAPGEHALETRAEFGEVDFQTLAVGFPAGTFFAGLTSIHWREVWKYGERAFRYCQHDIGHAVAALRFSAAVLGWQLIVMEHLADAEVAALLGSARAADFEEAEDEYPGLLAAVVPSQAALSGPPIVSAEAVERISRVAWRGRANRLSSSHMEWNIIAEAEQAAWKPPTQPHAPATTSSRAVLPRKRECGAERIIQQRRSCLALDGTTFIQASQFFEILARTVPALSPVPFDAFQASELRSPRIHLALFVHRVQQLPPGLYALARRREALPLLRAAVHSRFLWQKPEGCRPDLDLFLLEAGDFRKIASGISCGQAIGGDGVFSLGMLAEYEASLRVLGPWFYRRLFWEAGFIGQILYLQAEAAGIRSTGIGCYFDDPCHELLGLTGRQFQDLYHFTVGGPVEDTRLTTEPAYAG